MKPLERQSEILSFLRAMQREVRVEELSSTLAVSQLTIRRDLDQLAQDSTIIRTQGGCIAVGRAALESEYHKKVGLNYELKQAIGREASREVSDGNTLLLNDGSTIFHLAAHLTERHNLTIFTNSLALITETSRLDGVKLFILGGEYSDSSYSLRGSLLEQVLENYTFDIVFLGADAVDIKGRCMVASTEEARLTKIMLRSGTRKILLADHTKAGAAGHCSYGKLADFDTWITTAGMNQANLDEFRTMTNVRPVLSGANPMTVPQDSGH